MDLANGEKVSVDILAPSQQQEDRLSANEEEVGGSMETLQDTSSKDTVAQQRQGEETLYQLLCLSWIVLCL